MSILSRDHLFETDELSFWNKPNTFPWTSAGLSYSYRFAHVLLQEDKSVCDEWCCKDHGPDKCHRQYDCGRNAEKRGMEALKLRIDAIKQGKSRPGEGISEPTIAKYLPHTPLPKQTKPPMNKVGFLKKYLYKYCFTRRQIYLCKT